MPVIGYENSRQRGKPINLYFFKWGADVAQYYAYTDADKSVSYDAADGNGLIVYNPIPIQRDEVVVSGTLDKSMLKVSVPRQSEIALLYLGVPPNYAVTLTIRETHAGAVFEDSNSDPAILVAWRGRIISTMRNGGITEMSCEPAINGLRKVGLRRNWQFGCPHVLYAIGDGLCNADKTAATVNTTVTNLLGNRPRLPADFDPDPSHFLQGIFQWTDGDDNFRMATILDIDSSGGLWRVYLSIPPTGLAPGSAVTVIKGCPHNTTGCAAIHNNINNYGGQDKIPLKQPLGSSKNFYG